jgi:hypothetical protein
VEREVVSGRRRGGIGRERGDYIEVCGEIGKMVSAWSYVCVKLQYL